MDWTLEQLRSFVAAAEQGSFSEAARAMGRAQSVISTHIATLEAELGMELFDRSKRLPVLTTAGADLLAEAREVLRRCRRFDDRAIARYKGEAASLGVAIGDGIPHTAITHTLTELARKYPFVRVSLVLCPDAEAWQRVQEGDVQFALSYYTSRTWPLGCEGGCVAFSNQVIMTSASHSLAKKSPIAPSELALHRQIVVGDSSRGSLRHVMSTDTWETTSIMLALHMIRQGLGWAVMPEILLWELRNEPGFLMDQMNPPMPVVVDTGDWKLPPANIVMLWNRRHERTDIMDWFRQSMEKDIHRLAAQQSPPDKSAA